MELGAFSVSLAVKDIEASKLFYEKLGFAVCAGDQSQNWRIMKNDDHTIGLFQGMFDKNILTFGERASSRGSNGQFFTGYWPRILQTRESDEGNCPKQVRVS
jgi:hypothetical protein